MKTIDEVLGWAEENSIMAKKAMAFFPKDKRSEICLGIHIALEQLKSFITEGSDEI